MLQNGGWWGQPLTWGLQTLATQWAHRNICYFSPKLNWQHSREDLKPMSLLPNRPRGLGDGEVEEYKKWLAVWSGRAPIYLKNFPEAFLLVLYSTLTVIFLTITVRHWIMTYLVGFLFCVSLKPNIWLTKCKFVSLWFPFDINLIPLSQVTFNIQHPFFPVRTFHY